MELLLLLLPVVLLGAFAFGGSSDTEDDPAPPPDETGRVFRGTSDDEVIDGTPGDDLIFAAPASDIVNGQAGNDILLGEGGDDRLFGGAGEDILLGGNGNDVLAGDAGRDLLMGGADRDLLYGGGGDDLLIGGSDIDTLYGGAGNDVLSGVEITPADQTDPDLLEVANQINTLIDLRHGVSSFFSDRVTRSVISANVERPTFEGGLSSPPNPDILQGGEGADTLFGDYGDLLVGGGTDSADLFVAVMRSNAEPVTIGDFDPADRIEIDPDGLPAGPISYSLIDEGALIRVGDAAVVVVNGFRDLNLLSSRVSLSAV